MSSAPLIPRLRLEVRGVVQGVGFRPHVRRLAERLDPTGTCRKDATSVVIEIEGTLDGSVALTPAHSG